MPEPWNGHTERREHERECNEKLARLEKAWQKDICLATKGGKIWARAMWAIVMLMLSLTFGGNIYGISVASDQQAIDVEQSSNIKHNTEKIETMEKAQEKMVVTQEVIKEEVKDLKIMQMKALTILERIENQ